MFDIQAYENFSKKSLINKAFYNIGAGAFFHPYWTNIDYSSEHYKSHQEFPFLEYNLMDLKPLPIEDNSAEIIYSSHAIEHVNDEAVHNLLKETYRVLKPGGIRITTPNAWLEFQAYMRNDTSFWYWTHYTKPLSQASIHQLFLFRFASQLSEISQDQSTSKKYSDKEIKHIFSKNPKVETLDIFTQQCEFNPNFPGNHMNWWTYEKLIRTLKSVGFSPYISGWGQSVFPILRNTTLFDNTHPRVSLYIEAIK